MTLCDTGDIVSCQQSRFVALQWYFPKLHLVVFVQTLRGGRIIFVTVTLVIMEGTDEPLSFRYEVFWVYSIVPLVSHSLCCLLWLYLSVLLLTGTVGSCMDFSTYYPNLPLFYVVFQCAVRLCFLLNWVSTTSVDGPEGPVNQWRISTPHFFYSSACLLVLFLFTSPS